MLVLAPHPDDEVIGCGGLIAKIKNSGGKVFVLYLTVGETRDFTKKGLSTIPERQKEIETVAKFLKFDGWDIAFVGNDHHLRLDLLGQKALMDVIERDSEVAIEKVKPTMITFPSPVSYNQDHRIAALAVHASLRPASRNLKHFVPTVIAYESPADFWNLESQEINFWVSLSSKDLSTKLTALKLYRSQIRPDPNPRSEVLLKTLAVLRGSQIGVEFAEGYKLLRAIL
ncbi:PIG-L family deacetylase [Candidatus Curtissbacteria bacterium]|nr:PIG-L family deacetylase [Candidatus Curtissbacteria bacterium]